MCFLLKICVIQKVFVSLPINQRTYFAMKKTFLTLLFACLTALSSMAGGNISLKDVTGRTYYPKHVTGINPIAGTDQYARISDDGKRIVQHSFKNGQQTAVLFDVSDTQGEHINGFDSYVSRAEINKRINEKYPDVKYTNGYFGEPSPIPLEDAYFTAYNLPDEGCMILRAET